MTLLFAVKASSFTFQALHFFWVHLFKRCFANLRGIDFHGIRVPFGPLSSTIFVLFGGSDKGEIAIFLNRFGTSMVTAADLLFHLSVTLWVLFEQNTI